MSKNVLGQIHSQTEKMIHAYRQSEFSDTIQCAKKVIEKICSLVLRKAGTTPERYDDKKNVYREWDLGKILSECEQNDLLESKLCAELYLIKAWRNSLEHANDQLVLKSFASQSVEVIRKLYSIAIKVLGASPIQHWPDNLQTSIGNVLPFSPEDISAKDGQLVIHGAGGQRVCLDFLEDGASWTDADGNKKFYKGNISEGNDGKGWIG